MPISKRVPFMKDFVDGMAGRFILVPLEEVPSTVRTTAYDEGNSGRFEKRKVIAAIEFVFDTIESTQLE